MMDDVRTLKLRSDISPGYNIGNVPEIRVILIILSDFFMNLRNLKTRFRQKKLYHSCFINIIL